MLSSVASSGLTQAELRNDNTAVEPSCHVHRGVRCSAQLSAYPSSELGCDMGRYTAKQALDLCPSRFGPRVSKGTVVADFIGGVMGRMKQGRYRCPSAWRVSHPKLLVDPKPTCHLGSTWRLEQV